jgi:hypothetical protein
MMARKMPGQPFMNYITVPSIDAMSEAVQANGGVIVLPKQEIGMGMGWIACFKDPENNIIGLHQMAPAPAKAVAARRSAAQARRAPAKRAPAKRAPKSAPRAPKKKAAKKKRR